MSRADLRLVGALASRSRPSMRVSHCECELITHRSPPASAIAVRPVADVLDRLAVASAAGGRGRRGRRRASASARRAARRVVAAARRPAPGGHDRARRASARRATAPRRAATRRRRRGSTRTGGGRAWRPRRRARLGRRRAGRRRAARDHPLRLGRRVARGRGRRGAAEVARRRVALLRRPWPSRARPTASNSRRQPAPQRGRHRRRRRQLRPQLRLVALALERHPARQREVQHAAERVDVRARVDPPAADLLRRDVVQRPHPLPGARRRRCGSAPAWPARSRSGRRGRSASTSRFAGLTSRWTKPARWIASSAAPACATIAGRLGRVERPAAAHERAQVARRRRTASRCRRRRRPRPPRRPGSRSGGRRWPRPAPRPGSARGRPRRRAAPGAITFSATIRSSPIWTRRGRRRPSRRGRPATRSGSRRRRVPGASSPHRRCISEPDLGNALNRDRAPAYGAPRTGTDALCRTPLLTGVTFSPRPGHGRPGRSERDIRLPRPSPPCLVIYVTGHRNPDTDSIASAVGYAELMGRVDPRNALRARAARRAQHADALGARARAARASRSSCRT